MTRLGCDNGGIGWVLACDGTKIVCPCGSNFLYLNIKYLLWLIDLEWLPFLLDMIVFNLRPKPNLFYSSNKNRKDLNLYDAFISHIEYVIFHSSIVLRCSSSQWMIIWGPSSSFFKEPSVRTHANYRIVFWRGFRPDISRSTQKSVGLNGSLFICYIKD